MSNGIVEALDQAAKRVAKAMGEDAGKAVEKLYRDTGGKLKDSVERTVESDAGKAAEIKKIAEDMEKNAAKTVTTRAEKKAQADAQEGLRKRLSRVLDPSTEKASFGSSTSTDYKKTFFGANPDQSGNVVVHHAVEQQVKTRYPGLVSNSEMHSLQNLRGIPKGQINNRVHLSAIRKEWNEFYRTNPAPTQQDLLDFATKIDDKYGDQFDPPVR